jgi:hypothetical protein
MIRCSIAPSAIAILNEFLILQYLCSKLRLLVHNRSSDLSDNAFVLKTKFIN